MPELPDVEVYRRYAEATSLHQKITAVEVGDTRLLEHASTGSLSDALVGRELTSADRYGKYLFLETDARAVLVLHFGMTGYPDYGRMSEAPEYTQLLLRFPEGYALAYINKRMLGKIAVVEDRSVYEDDLGPDALAFSEEQFRELLAGGRGTVKATLMNQKRIAGLGNVYTDEVLFHARVHPRARAADLATDTVDRIFRAMHEVVAAAVDAKARPQDMPDDFLLPRRKPGEDCPRCGGEVEKTTVSGRSTYFCPSCLSGG